MNIIIKRIYYSLVFLGCFYCSAAYGQAANKEIDSLQILLSKANTDTNKIILLLQISKDIDCHDTAGKFKYAYQALHLAENKKWGKGCILATKVIGDVYYDCFKNYTAAITYYEQAAQLAKTYESKYYEALELSYIADTYEKMAQHYKALDYYKVVLTLKPTEKFTISVLGNIGIIYTHLGDYNNALMYYDSSVKMLDDAIESPKTNTLKHKLEKGNMLVTIGDIYLTMSQYDEALENYNNAQKISLETKNDLLSIWALNGIAKTYRSLKNYPKSIEYYVAALNDSRNGQKLPEEARIMNELANVYLEANETGKALECAIGSLKLAEENNYPNLLPLSYTTLGKIYTAQKKYKEAVAYLQKAVSMCSHNCALNDEKDAWLALSNTYQQMKPSQALAAYKNYVAIRDSIYNIDVANRLTRENEQAKYSRQKQATESENRLKMQKQEIYTFSAVGGLMLVLLLSFFVYRNYDQQKKANVVIRKANDTISTEKQKSEMLLLNILPDEVATELKNNGSVQAKLFDHVTVLFTDFVNFTEAGERLSPEELVAELDECFKTFDSIISKYSIEKIKTVGDAYLAVSGLPNPCSSHASEIIKAAIEFRNFMIARKRELGERTFAMRIGINSGTVVAGIVGVKKFAYDIWGDTVNTAARMEQYSEPDKINISQTTYELIKNEFTCIDRGDIDAKHKGKMHMYFVEGTVNN